MKIQSVFVSARGHSVFMSLRTMGWISISLYAHSSAVRLTSPLPCRQCESPVQIRPPLRNTGRYKVDPTCSSLRSRFEHRLHLGQIQFVVPHETGGKFRWQETDAGKFGARQIEVERIRLGHDF